MDRLVVYGVNTVLGARMGRDLIAELIPQNLGLYHHSCCCLHYALSSLLRTAWWFTRSGVKVFRIRDMGQIILLIREREKRNPSDPNYHNQAWDCNKEGDRFDYDTFRI